MATAPKKPKTTVGKPATRKTTTKAKVKPAAKRTEAKKSAVVKAVKPVIETVAKPVIKPVVEEMVLRKRELIERVMARSGIKKKDAKPTIEAMLAVLGEALAAGEMLNLQPLGRVIVKRQIDKANATVLVCRVRRRKENAGSVVTIAPKN